MDSFFRALEPSVRKVLQCEDPAAQAQALTVMPLDAIRSRAEAALALNAQLGLPPEEQGLALEDLVVQGLLAWFKRDFMTWMDNPACSFCSSGDTYAIGPGAPDATEAAQGGGRVELYMCKVCDQQTRFVRYLSASKLLQTRTGRCGEWAHCFLLVLRAAGVEARHVQDYADHVWCEYYSQHLGRWVQLDPCEAAFDTPLLYEGGWGKRLDYVIALGRHGAADVTRRYIVSDWATCSQRRRAVPEMALAQRLGQISSQLRRGLAAELLRSLQVRDITEQLQLLALSGAHAQRDALNLPGRQSGATAWRTSRGEAGESGASASGAALAPPTLYRMAADERLPPAFAAAGRLTGGACRASGEFAGARHEAQRLFDGGTGFKWLDFGGGGEGGAAWAEYRLLQAQAPVVLVAYDLVAAEDRPERDPADWVLECIPDAGASSSGSGSSSSSSGGSRAPTATAGLEAWVVVDEQRRQRFQKRNQLRSFTLASSCPPSRRFRLRITRTADPAAADSTQLACWNLYAAPQVARGALGARGPSASGGPQLGGAFERAAMAAVERRPEGGLLPGEVQLLLRILGNIQSHPDQPRYRELRACKVSALLAHAAAPLVLLAAGFRPLLAPRPQHAAPTDVHEDGAPAGAGVDGRPMELVLRAEGNADDVAAATRLHAALLSLWQQAKDAAGDAGS